MTPSSSFVKFPVEMAAPVAQGAWLRRSAENVFGVAAGDVEPSVRRGRGGWEESGSGTAAMRRGRRGTPLGHTRTCETPRMHGASPACRTAAANRAPSFPPFTTARRSACDLPLRPMFLLALMRFQSRPLSSARRARSQRFPPPPPPSPLCLLILASLPFLVPSWSAYHVCAEEFPSMLISSCKPY